MPALAKSRVGSLSGTSDELRTTRWPREAKKARKAARISSAVIALPVPVALLSTCVLTTPPSFARIFRQVLQALAPARPQPAQTLPDQPGGKAPPQQEGPQLADAQERLVARVLAPVAPCQVVQGRLLGDVPERLGHTLLDYRPRHPARPKRLPDPVPAEAVVRHAAAGEPRGEALVVQEVLGAEPGQRLVHHAGREALARQHASQLRFRVVPASEP